MSTSDANSVPGNVQAASLTASTSSALVAVEPTTVVDKADDGRTVMRSAIIKPSIFSRDYFLARIDISNADTPFINLVGMFPAFESYFNSTLVAAHVTGYSFFRGKLVLTFNIANPGSCFGAYVVQALCDGFVNPVGSGLDDATVDDIHTSCSDVFGILNCETSNSVVLELPMVHPYESASMSTVTTPLGISTMWRILIWPLTPVTSTIATTALGQISVYAHLDDPVFEVQKMQGKKNAFTASVDKSPKKQGTVGRIASTTAAIASAVTNVAPFLAPFTGPVAVGMGAIATIADIFGFTRDTSPMMPTPLVNRFTSTLATIDGTDPSNVMALSNSNAVSIDPRIGGGTGEDPMSFASLFERWTLIRSFSLSKATAVGGVYNVPVTPTCPGITLGRAFHTTAGYVGLPFTYWSGDMEYLIYIPSSTNVKGTMQVFWDPNVFPTTATVYAADPTVFLTGTMIDLSGSSSTIVKIDMAGQNVCKFNEPVYDTGTTRALDYCNGSLSFYLTSEVTMPRADAVALTVLIFARGGSNMKFHVPKNMTTVGGDVSSVTPVISTFRLQGLTVIDESVETTTADLTHCAQIAPVVQVNFGEDIASVRGLTQKFSLAGSVSISNKGVADTPQTFAGVCFPRNSFAVVDSNGAGIFPAAAAIGYNGAGVGTVPNLWSWAGHMLMMYAGFRGGHRVKVLQRDVGAGSDDLYPLHCAVMTPGDLQRYVTAFPGYTVPTNASLFVHEDIQPISRESGLEYSIPFYGCQRYERGFNMISHGFDQAYVDHHPLAIFWAPSWSFKAANTVKAFDVYMAAGPDISVAHFRRVPSLVVPA